jgi:hypothetical protein
MVIQYQPGRLRRNSDQPTAISNVLVAISGSSHRTGDIQLSVATCSARSRHGLGAVSQRRRGCGRLAWRCPGRTAR